MYPDPEVPLWEMPKTNLYQAGISGLFHPQESHPRTPTKYHGSGQILTTSSRVSPQLLVVFWKGNPLIAHKKPRLAVKQLQFGQMGCGRGFTPVVLVVQVKLLVLVGRSASWMAMHIWRHRPACLVTMENSSGSSGRKKILRFVAHFQWAKNATL